MNPGRKPSSIPPKVLLVVGSFPPSLCGVGDYAARLAATLAPGRVSIVTSGPVPSSGKVPVHTMGDWGFRRLARFLGFLDAERPDVIHFQYPSRGFGWHLLPNLLPMILRILRPSLRQIVTLHESPGIHPFRKASYLFFTLVADAVVAPSSEVRRDLERWFPWIRGKTTVIPIGSFLPSRTAPITIPPGKPLLVFPGFLLPKKGPREALEAAALLKEEYPRLRLLFASDGGSHPSEKEWLEARVRELGLQESVVFTGRLQPPQLAGVLKRADLVLLPFHDGASTRRSTLASALALGCPVVTTNAPGILEEYRHGGVLLCEPKDPRSLASAVREYLNDPGVRHNMRRSRPHLAALFDWKRIAATHQVLYEDVQGGGL